MEDYRLKRTGSNEIIDGRIVNKTAFKPYDYASESRGLTKARENPPRNVTTSGGIQNLGGKPMYDSNKQNAALSDAYAKTMANAKRITGTRGTVSDTTPHLGGLNPSIPYGKADVRANTVSRPDGGLRLNLGGNNYIDAPVSAFNRLGNGKGSFSVLGKSESENLFGDAGAETRRLGLAQNAVAQLQAQGASAEDQYNAYERIMGGDTHPLAAFSQLAIGNAAKRNKALAERQGELDQMALEKHQRELAKPVKSGRDVEGNEIFSEYNSALGGFTPLGGTQNLGLSPEAIQSILNNERPALNGLFESVSPQDEIRRTAQLKNLEAPGGPLDKLYSLILDGKTDALDVFLNKFGLEDSRDVVLDYLRQRSAQG